MEDRIEQEYVAGGYGLGWRLLYSPAKTLCGARVAFIGLNPGGRGECPDQAKFAMSSGSAYEDEVWEKGCDPGESPLQRQVRMLLKLIGEQPSEVLAGNLVPFRSPDWKTLPNRESALRFGKSLWRKILAQARPSLVIAMGAESRDAMADILCVDRLEKVPVNWDKVSARRGEFLGGTLIGIPHLSRYTIFGRAESEGALKKLFRGLDTALVTTPVKKAAKKSAPKKAVRRTTFGPDQVITLKVTANPKLKGSASHKRFALYENGMTVESALHKGIRRADLIWDTERDFIEIE